MNNDITLLDFVIMAVATIVTFSVIAIAIAETPMDRTDKSGEWCVEHGGDAIEIMDQSGETTLVCDFGNGTEAYLGSPEPGGPYD